MQPTKTKYMIITKKNTYKNLSKVKQFLKYCHPVLFDSVKQ